MKISTQFLVFVTILLGITTNLACSGDDSQVEEAAQEQQQEEEQEEENDNADAEEEDLPEPEVSEIEELTDPEPPSVMPVQPEPVVQQPPSAAPAPMTPRRVWYVVANNTPVLSKGDSSGTIIRSLARGEKIVGNASGDYVRISSGEWVPKNKLSTKIISNQSRKARWR